MQTFLPFPDVRRSAQSLDWRRLGKQRVEAWQILNTLQGRSRGWSNHPAVRMWRGHEQALAQYGVAVCVEWRLRGYRDTMLERFQEELVVIDSTTMPSWWGDEAFHRSHRANLVRKLPEHYGPLFGDMPWEPYVWPKAEA